MASPLPPPQTQTQPPPQQAAFATRTPSVLRKAVGGKAVGYPPGTQAPRSRPVSMISSPLPPLPPPSSQPQPQQPGYPVPNPQLVQHQHIQQNPHVQQHAQYNQQPQVQQMQQAQHGQQQPPTQAPGPAPVYAQPHPPNAQQQPQYTQQQQHVQQQHQQQQYHQQLQHQQQQHQQQQHQQQQQPPALMRASTLPIHQKPVQQGIPTHIQQAPSPSPAPHPQQVMSYGGNPQVAASASSRHASISSSVGVPPPGTMATPPNTLSSPISQPGGDLRRSSLVLDSSNVQVCSQCKKGKVLIYVLRRTRY